MTPDHHDWLPIRLPSDPVELARLLETEKAIGDRENAKIMEKYLKHLIGDNNE